MVRKRSHDNHVAGSFLKT